MALDLKRVVIWSRSYDEYVRCFSLSKLDLAKKILSCADGAASFNLEATQRGFNVISTDPIYNYTPKEIEKIIQLLKISYDQFVEHTYFQ